jgi:hypothetical protein
MAAGRSAQVIALTADRGAHRIVGAAALFCLLCASVPAAAGEPGLPAGPLVAKPSVAANLVFDSNVYRTSPGTEKRDLGLDVSPAIALVYPGDNFRWELGALYRLFLYFGVADGGPASRTDLARVTEFSVGTSLDINRLGKLGFYVAPSLGNVPIRRGYGEGTEQQIYASVPLELRIRPTGAFSIDVGGRWAWRRTYDEGPSLISASPLILGDLHDVGGGLGIDWKFFPRSHFVVDADVGHTFWLATVGAAALDTNRFDGTYWRVSLGLKGDITRKASFRAIIGYGNIYYAEAPAQNLTGIDGLIGDVEISFRPATTQRIAIGFRRTFSYDYYADRIEDTSPYLSYLGLFAQRLEVSGDVAYDYREMMGGVNRNEHSLGAGVSLFVIGTEYFRIGGSYRFSGTLAATPVTADSNALYTDHRVLFGVTLGYR